MMIDYDLVRVFLAFFVGYFLTVSGSLSQVVTQNNLASPSTLGFDGLAVICIILAQFSLTAVKLSIPLEIMSFLIFICFFSLIYFTKDKFQSSSVFESRKNIQLIILIGLGFNLLVGAVFSVIQFLFIALNWEFPTGIWFGNFKFHSLSTLWVYLFVFVVLQFLLLRLCSALRLISIGHDFALGLSVKVKRVQDSSLLISLFLTGLVISFFGVFSFLGLIFPHLLRLFGFFRKDMRNELLYGSVLTGLVFCAVDTVCYNLDIYGTELPVGMVSSVAGALILLVLLLRKQISRNY